MVWDVFIKKPILREYIIKFVAATISKVPNEIKLAALSSFPEMSFKVIIWNTISIHADNRDKFNLFYHFFNNFYQFSLYLIILIRFKKYYFFRFAVILYFLKI